MTMYYDDIVTKMIEVIDNADKSIPDNYRDMESLEKMVFLCYEFYHLGYEDGKADRNIGTCLHEH